MGGRNLEFFALFGYERWLLLVCFLGKSGKHQHENNQEIKTSVKINEK